jgi:hypothetical protein
MYSATARSQETTMATIKGEDGYTLSGETECGGKATSTIKPGERFIARELSYTINDLEVYPPRRTSGARVAGDWEVYLRSGITGIIPRNKIRVLPDEPLMKLNYAGCKENWHKRQFDTRTVRYDALAAKEHGINYFKILARASDGDLKAMAEFFSFSRFMDTSAAEEYYPETFVLLHVVGDEIFANYYKSCPKKIRESYRDFFSMGGSDNDRSDFKTETVSQTEFSKDI